MRRRLFTPAVILTVAIALPSESRASVFLVPDGSQAEPKVQRAFIRFEDAKETMIEELEVQSSARAFLWIRAIPSDKPTRTTANAELLPALADLTALKPPFNDQIRNELFGPSVVTVLTRKVSPPQKLIRDPLDTSDADRTLEIESTIELHESIPTSTITLLPIPPPKLDAMLARTGTKLDSKTLIDIQSHIDRRFTIFVSVVRDPRPGSTNPARLGPFRYDFVAPRAIYPLSLSNARGIVQYRVYTLSPEPLAPVSMEAVWLQEPWHTWEENSRVYYVSYNGAVLPETQMMFDLGSRYELPIPKTPQLMRANMTLAAHERLDLEMVKAPDPIPLPGPGARGTASDLITCILLGLTPLLYTPESWFILWLGARARARARREGRAFGIKLWSVYALAVGVFWFFTLEHNARIAALIPALIAVVQLALPYVDRDPLPVRAQFKKKKK